MSQQEMNKIKQEIVSNPGSPLEEEKSSPAEEKKNSSSQKSDKNTPSKSEPSPAKSDRSAGSEDVHAQGEDVAALNEEAEDGEEQQPELMEDSEDDDDEDMDDEIPADSGIAALMQQHDKFKTAKEDKTMKNTKLMSENKSKPAKMGGGDLLDDGYMSHLYNANGEMMHDPKDKMSFADEDRPEFNSPYEKFDGSPFDDFKNKDVGGIYDKSSGKKDKIMLDDLEHFMTGKKKKGKKGKKAATVGFGVKKSGKKKGATTRESWSSYIHKVLKTVHGENCGMSSKGMDIVDCFAHDIFERLVDEATRLMRLNSRNTMTSREMQTACRLILPGQLAQHAIQDGTQAVRNYDEACGKVRDDDIFRNNEDGGQSVASSRMMGEDDTDDEDSEGDDDDMAEKFNKQKRKAAGDDKMKLPKNMDEDMMMFMDKTDKSMANKESFFDEAAMKKEKIMAQYHTDQMGDMMGMEKMEMPQ